MCVGSQQGASWVRKQESQWPANTTPSAPTRYSSPDSEIHTLFEVVGLFLQSLQQKKAHGPWGWCVIIALESFLRWSPISSFYAEKQSGANDVISLFNLNLIPKSNKRHAMTDWVFILQVQLACCSVMRGNSSLPSLFWMTAHCLRASQRGAGCILTTEASTHLHFSEGKKGRQAF